MKDGSIKVKNLSTLRALREKEKESGRKSTKHGRRLKLDQKDLYAVLTTGEKIYIYHANGTLIGPISAILSQRQWKQWREHLKGNQKSNSVLMLNMPLMMLSMKDLIAHNIRYYRSS